MTEHIILNDAGACFQIVPNTRKVVVPPARTVIGTAGEYNAEQITFMCPKAIDGHAVKNCSLKYIAWQNVDGDDGHDELAFVKEDAESVYFAWVVSEGITATTGVVSFSVHFEDRDANDVLLYRFSTTTCKDCEILDSVNAVLNAYQAIYVAGETLVLADYNVVKEGELALDSQGFVPEGTVEITGNGLHDVGRYAQANVAVDAPTGKMTITKNGTYDVTDYAEAQVNLEFADPKISIGLSGYVSASANGKSSTVKLSSEHDPDFVKENIRHGVTIFGVRGKYMPHELVQGKIEVAGPSSYGEFIDVDVYYSGIAPVTGEFVHTASYVASAGETFTNQFVKGSNIILMPFFRDTERAASVGVFQVTGNAETIVTEEGWQYFVVEPTGNFEIYISLYAG